MKRKEKLCNPAMCTSPNLPRTKYEASHLNFSRIAASETMYNSLNLLSKSPTLKHASEMSQSAGASMLLNAIAFQLFDSLTLQPPLALPRRRKRSMTLRAAPELPA